MTNTLITSEDLQDLSTPELQSKFFQVSRDVARLRQTCDALPLAEASLRNIASELALRRLRPPKP